MLSADSVQRSGNGRGALRKFRNAESLQRKRQLGTESNLTGSTFRFRTAWQQPGGNLHRQRYGFFVARNIDDSSFADRVELRTADAAFGTLFVERCFRRIRNTTTTVARALNAQTKVMGWYDPAGNASSDVTNMGLNRSGLDSYYYIGIQCNGSYSSIPTTSQINTAAANFPLDLLDFYLSDECNDAGRLQTPSRPWARKFAAAVLIWLVVGCCCRIRCTGCRCSSS